MLQPISNPDMLKQIKSFSKKETMAVLDYVSRLATPEEVTVNRDWRNPDFD